MENLYELTLLYLHSNMRCIIVIMKSSIIISIMIYVPFLNQVCADLWLMHNWFLEIAFVCNVYMHMYVTCVCPEGIHVNGPCMTS